MTADVSLVLPFTCACVALGCSVPAPAAPDARTWADAAPSIEGSCNDGRDEDGDGAIDCEDVDCASVPACHGGFVECVGTFGEADVRVAPIDVVWVVDASGSMGQEAAMVQERLNDFAAAIVASGVDDYRVVLVTRRGFVEVPAPLGTDAAHFLFVDEDVDSDQPLSDALARYEGYGAFLRPEAMLHFVFVTDDESAITDTAFLDAMTAQLGHGLVAHALASPPGSVSSVDACTGPYGDAQENGERYAALVAATGGVFASICEADWSGIFDRLTTAVAVATPVPCTYVIPAPPDGETLDPALVNVVHVPGDGGSPRTVARSLDDCASGQGWRYDDDALPTEVRLCPASCTEVTDDGAGRIDVQFGCTTILL